MNTQKHKKSNNRRAIRKIQTLIERMTDHRIRISAIKCLILDEIPFSPEFPEHAKANIDIISVYLEKEMCIEHRLVWNELEPIEQHPTDDGTVDVGDRTMTKRSVSLSKAMSIISKKKYIEPEDFQIEK